MNVNRARILGVLVGFGLAEIKALHIRELGYKIVETPPDDRLAGEPHAIIVPKPSRTNAERMAARCVLILDPTFPDGN